MKMQRIKTGLLLGLLSMVLIGCGSTASQSDRVDDMAAIEDSDVATGTVSDSGLIASSIEDMAASADTVFYFDFDKAILKPESRAALRIHAANLKDSNRDVRLEGHADERGTREYNMALGERRANAVKEFLVLQSVNGNRIEVISYGEESPATMGSNEQSWALNRRVELK